jgi:Pyruvate/2-oxoacid:ferredoxin oxidoreductase gamma subunit
VFETLHELDCIVAGDIGCYTLGVLPPFTAMDSCVCMGASIGVGLGLRHVLPPEQARRVVSVIGDSTFVHSGITGLVEMVYNPPPTGHVVLILDNGTTAMTGHQEHPGTGRTLEHEPTGKVSFEGLARSLGSRTSLSSINRATPRDLPSDCRRASRTASSTSSLCASPASWWRARSGNTSATPARPAPKPSSNEHRHERPGITNLIIAGLGGQGVLKAAGIVADVAFRLGYDVKQSELHGMSQRGGSVSSDIRFGPEVFSPMVPTGEADFLVVAAADQVEVNRHQLRPGGVLITPEMIDATKLTNKKSGNVALLGVLSQHLDIAESVWLDAIRAAFPEKLHAANLQAFALGRNGILASRDFPTVGPASSPGRGVTEQNERPVAVA